jgi:hypothetical protein
VSKFLTYTCVLHAGGEMGASKQQVRFGGGERFRVILLDDVRHTESQGSLMIIIENNSSFRGIAYVTRYAVMK